MKIHHLGFLRMNPPTIGHEAVVNSIMSNAKTDNSEHTIVLSHSHDAKKNPLTPEQKLKHARAAFPDANIITSSKEKPTVLHHASDLHAKGVSHLVLHVGSDRVEQMQDLLNKYNGKKSAHGYFKFKKITVKPVGDERTEGSEGVEGASGTAMRKHVIENNKKGFNAMAPSNMSKEQKTQMYNDVRNGMMKKESVSPVGLFLLGGPGSGKDYVLKNIFSNFDLTEVQGDQILNGLARNIIEANKNIVINGISDPDKIEIIKTMLEGYDFDYVHVTVTNKVSRLRNEQRNHPINESKRIDKFLKAEKLSSVYECFKFNNSINLKESSEIERVIFANQIEKLLERIINNGLVLIEKIKSKNDLSVIEEDINALFEMQLDGTDEYVKHAIAMTPGQSQEIKNDENSTECACKGQGNCQCATNEKKENNETNVKSFKQFKSIPEEEVDITPTIDLKKPKRQPNSLRGSPRGYNSAMDGLPVTTRGESIENPKGFMPTPPQVPAPKGGHPVPKGYERIKRPDGTNVLRKIP